jgi:hypothetical protein
MATNRMIVVSVNTQSNSPPSFLFQEVTTANIAAVQAAVAGGVQAFNESEFAETSAGIKLKLILERTVISGG